MKKRLAVLAVTTALAFGSTIGVASATYEEPMRCNNGVGNGPDCRPGKAHFNNDDEPDVGPGIPGDPGSRGAGRGGANAY